MLFGEMFGGGQAFDSGVKDLGGSGFTTGKGERFLFIDMICGRYFV